MLHGSKAITSTEEYETPIIRLRSMEIGGLEAERAWTAVLTDDYFDSIGSIIGTDLDAVVGGSFFREFVVAFDYPAGALRLAPLADLSHIDDSFQRVGVEVFDGDAGFTIYTVYEGTDAEAQGIAVDDELLALDGESTGDMSLQDVNDRLEGEPGTGIQMDLSGESGDYTVTVQREDLLPVLE